MSWVYTTIRKENINHGKKGEKRKEVEGDWMDHGGRN